MSVWNTLSKIDVSKHIEKKNGFSYVSWAWAWAILKTNYPSAYYVKETHEINGYKIPYTVDPAGNAFVTVTVHIPEADESQTEIMPVLNHANRPIQNPDSFQVNASLQRCLVKCIAALGLGISLYAGEDLPLAVESVGGDSSPQKADSGRGSLGNQTILAGVSAEKPSNNNLSGGPQNPDGITDEGLLVLVSGTASIEELTKLYENVAGNKRLPDSQLKMFSQKKKELMANG